MLLQRTIPHSKARKKDPARITRAIPCVSALSCMPSNGSSDFSTYIVFIWRRVFIKLACCLGAVVRRLLDHGSAVELQRFAPWFSGAGENRSRTQGLHRRSHALISAGFWAASLSLARSPFHVMPFFHVCIHFVDFPTSVCSICISFSVFGRS